MFSGLKSRWRNWANMYRENKLIGLWEAKKYDKMAELLRRSEHYKSMKFSDFPFIFFLINEKDKLAISTLLDKINYKAELLNDDVNPMSISPVCYAFLDGEHEIVQILEKNGADLKKPNQSLQNVLHLSAIYKQQEAFKKGVSMNLDFNLQDEFGNTPFHYAARTGSPQMTAVMVAARAKRLENKINQYPVHMAIQSGSLETFELLKNDALIPYPKYHPIHSASRSGNPKMVEQILKLKPASLNMKDQKGLTPLHHAIIIEDVDVTKNLLNQPGILISETDQFGNTPLHLAMMNVNHELSKMLLEKGANLDVLNQDNLSPADYGITSKNKQIHSLLLTWREKSKKVDEWSQTKY